MKRATPVQMALGYERKQVEGAVGSKTVSSSPPASASVPAMTSSVMG